MRRTVLFLLVSALAAAGVLTAPARADAYWKAPCLSGTKRPVCYFWTGKATFVADGDTIDVDIFGDGTAAPKRVRMMGVNAMEQRVYSSIPRARRGECHSLAATARLEGLIRGGGRRVRLSAQNPSSRSGRRLRRMVLA